MKNRLEEPIPTKPVKSDTDSDEDMDFPHDVIDVPHTAAAEKTLGEDVGDMDAGDIVEPVHEPQIAEDEDAHPLDADSEEDKEQQLDVIQHLDTEDDEEDAESQEHEDSPEPKVRRSSRVRKKSTWMTTCQYLVNQHVVETSWKDRAEFLLKATKEPVLKDHRDKLLDGLLKVIVK